VTRTVTTTCRKQADIAAISENEALDFSICTYSPTLGIHVKVVDLYPKGISKFPYNLELYVDFTVSYITGNADIDAKFSRNGRIVITIEVLNDDEIIWMEPVENPVPHRSSSASSFTDFTYNPL
jgi:hypothetical protein